MTAIDTQNEPAIELIEVAKHYGNVTVLEGVTLTVAPGEFIALLGPSGCGKSTLLKLIAGLDELSGGEIYIGGRLANYLKPAHRDVAMVFQNYALYPHMTVRENLGFPLKMGGVEREVVRSKVEAAAGLLQLSGQLDRFPDELSGGQRQRVALGRAIVREPYVFLMDEPLSNLDALLRVEMRAELVRLHKRVGRTTIYVTHDQVEAMTMASRIVLMNRGIIQQVGTPAEIYSTPANTFVATFVGSPPMNLFKGNLERSGQQMMFRGPFEVVIDTIAPAGPVTIGIRPEHVEVGDSEVKAGLAAVIDAVERVGPDAYLRATSPQGVALTARVDGATTPREGDRIWLRFSTQHLRLFDAAGNLVMGKA
ncbi:ABC transporter ATP-binding protein [Nordella sp. HKS 07]|uniref:ABC transporter ATP-binding protein n=1 Tax=Nordella sp. HKS 07 TaxID=2712222 RepID=UPI0021104C11|nr:sn-glycerol-3-phosphate ABC transporter ATP-binding protein UgpC [Nordella sp. HKS 07]